MKNVLFLISLFVSATSNAQSELWHKEVNEETYMAQLEDGNMFLKDKNTIRLLDHLNGKTKWKIDFSTEKQPQFFEDLPIMYFDGRSYAVIDATSGYIIDESDTKTEILSINYYWDIGRVIVEMDQDKSLHILSIDLHDLSKSWNTKIGPVERTFFGLVSRESENRPVITEDGSLIIVDKKYMAIVDVAGAVTKRMDFDKSLISLDYNKAKKIFYLLEGKKTLHFIDIVNGATTATFEFSKSDLKLDVLGDGSTISVIQKNELRILDSELGVQVGSKGFPHKIDQTYIDENSGAFYILAKKILAEIDHTSGDIKREARFAKGFNDIRKIYDKIILNGSSGAIPVDLETLQLAYDVLPDIPAVQDYVEDGEYVIYTNKSGDNFTLSVVDNSGNIIWDKSFYSAFTPSLDIIGEGILIINGRKVRYLNIKNGKSIWNENVEVGPSFTYGIDHASNDLYMYSKKRLYRFDYDDGTLTKSNDKFKFDDFDYAVQQPQLMVLPNAIFLKGSNTIIVVSKEGQLIHKKTYERISNVSTFIKLANLVVTAAAVGTGDVGEIVTVYSNDGIIHRGGLAEGLDQSWAISEDLKYERQTKQNRSSNAYPYVFTKLENGKRGLIFLNPSTGEERFFIVLDEKDPDYIVDDVDGILFHLKNGNLKAFDLK